jgi:hypothetical protein
MSLFAEAAILFADRQAAEQLYEILAPWSKLHCFTGPIYYGVVSRSLGRLAAFLGRADAEDLLRWALGEHRRVGAHYWATAAAVDLAEFIIGTGDPDRVREAAQLLDEFEDGARQSGYVAAVQRLEMLRRSQKG